MDANACERKIFFHRFKHFYFCPILNDSDHSEVSAASFWRQKRDFQAGRKTQRLHFQRFLSIKWGSGNLWLSRNVSHTFLLKSELWWEISLKFSFFSRKKRFFCSENYSAIAKIIWHEGRCRRLNFQLLRGQLLARFQTLCLLCLFRFGSEHCSSK